MTDRHHQVAEQIVQKFKQGLSKQALANIQDAQLLDLNLHIRRALSTELDHAAERLETLVQELRAEVEKPELGM